MGRRSNRDLNDTASGVPLPRHQGEAIRRAWMPAAPSLVRRPDGVEFTGPYSKAFVAEARILGGTWHGDRWLFPLNAAFGVRDLASRCYGNVAWGEATREPAAPAPLPVAPRVACAMPAVAMGEDGSAPLTALDCERCVQSARLRRTGAAYLRGVIDGKPVNVGVKLLTDDVRFYYEITVDGVRQESPRNGDRTENEIAAFHAFCQAACLPPRRLPALSCESCDKDAKVASVATAPRTTEAADDLAARIAKLQASMAARLTELEAGIARLDAALRIGGAWGR